MNPIYKSENDVEFLVRDVRELSASPEGTKYLA